MTRVALYTSGFIGGGHLARAEAIQRGLARHKQLNGDGSASSLKVFYAKLHLNLPAGVTCDVQALSTDPSELRAPDTALASETARALLEFAPDLLLVDLAFQDLRFILPSLSCPAWLLLRWIPKKLISGPFNKTYQPAQYARIMAIEPGLPFEVPEQLEPIVVCNPDECHSRAELRAHLGLTSQKPLSLIAQTGQPQEAEGLELLEREAFPHHEIARMSLHDETPLFPLAPWLPGADRIVGGAGYNLYWETRWLGLSERSELHAFSRGIDDQSPRMRHGKDYVMQQNGADQLATWIAAG